MSKDLSTKYYQENKQRTQKKACQTFKLFLKKWKKQNETPIWSWTLENLSEDEKKTCWA